MIPIFFKDQFEFRNWLELNHSIEKELVVGFYKVKSPKYNLSWSESVDQALCFGWIDGIRKSIDNESYSIRFTPRKKSSIWSKINIDKVEKLKISGLMKESGLLAYSFKNDKNTNIYSFEKDNTLLSEDHEKIFKSNQKAWNYFSSLSPSYKKMSINWIISAKTELTRLKILNLLISNFEEHINIWKQHKK